MIHNGQMKFTPGVKDGFTIRKTINIMYYINR